MTHHRPFSPGPNGHPTPVDTMTGELRRQGAIDIATRMSVAAAVQREVIQDDHRFLLTPNDGAYRTYAYLFAAARLPHLRNNPHLGSEEVVVGEIPRSARSIPQVLYGKQPNQGRTIRTVFERIGSNVSQLGQETGKIPADLRLDQVLILPEDGDVMILPPQTFQEASVESVQAVADGVRTQISPDAALLDIESLVASFEKGLYGNDTN
jgi:hypothetical protein